MKNEKDLENMKLSDSELDNVNGGIIFNATGISGSNPDYPYEVLDAKGDVVFRAKDYNGAVGFAMAGGYAIDYKDINNWDEIQEIRRRNH